MIGNVMSFKKIIRKRTPPLVWAALAQAKIELKLAKKEHHANSDLVNEMKDLIRRLPSKYAKYYLDIGAHDGRSHSNTYYLDLSLGWHGVLVEPVLHHSFSSRKFRTVERNVFVNAACVGPSFELPAIKLIYLDLMTLAPDISENSIEDWVTGGTEYLPINQVPVEIYAKAITAERILDESGAPSHIGVLSVDVEGAELDVLKGINFSKYKFAIVILETARKSETTKFVEQNGYRYWKHIGQNHIFLLESFASSL
jgi:FkbM family methyltransferase